MENPNFIFHGSTKYIVMRSKILPVSSKIYLVMLLLFFLKISLVFFFEMDISLPQVSLELPM